MEQTPQQQTPEPFDHPIDADELKAIADQYKSLGYDKQVPHANMFRGEQSQEFYLGMVAAFSMCHNLIQQAGMANVADEMVEVMQEGMPAAVPEDAASFMSAGQVRTVELLMQPISAFLIHSTMIAQGKVKRIITF